MYYKVYKIRQITIICFISLFWNSNFKTWYIPILGKNLVSKPPDQMEKAEPRPWCQLWQPYLTARTLPRQRRTLQFPAFHAASRPLRPLLSAASLLLSVLGGCSRRRPSHASFFTGVFIVSAGNVTRAAPSVLTAISGGGKIKFADFFPIASFYTIQLTWQ